MVQGHHQTSLLSNIAVITSNLAVIQIVLWQTVQKFLNYSSFYSVSSLNAAMTCLKYRVIILSENFWLPPPVGTFIFLTYAIQLTTDTRGRVAPLRDTQYLLDKIWTLYSKFVFSKSVCTKKIEYLCRMFNRK